MPCSPLKVSALLLPVLLTGCGGGTGSDGTTPRQAAECDSTTFWANTTLFSGARIPDNSTTGVSVSWNNQNCRLQNVTSLSLDICLDHARPADLVWTVTPPGSSSSFNLTAPTQWNETGSSCDLGTGRRQSINALTALPSVQSAQGVWTLSVSDRNGGVEGSLMRWRVLVGGDN